MRQFWRQPHRWGTASSTLAVELYSVRLSVTLCTRLTNGRGCVWGQPWRHRFFVYTRYFSLASTCQKAWWDDCISSMCDNPCCQQFLTWVDFCFHSVLVVNLASLHSHQHENGSVRMAAWKWQRENGSARMAAWECAAWKWQREISQRENGSTNMCSIQTRSIISNNDKIYIRWKILL